MNQQEIFQNMTKDWSFAVNGEERFPFTINSKSDGRGICFFQEKNRSERDEVYANGRAVIVMYNNTYGKGINPEGVEKMKAVLEHLLTLEAFKKRFPFLATLSEEALTAAKL
jgi:hypothetical protein